MADYDSIIIGAGHNGLVCASLLADAGQNVLVLEASDAVGGLARTREFHPGFKVSVAQSANHFPIAIIKALGLVAHGLESQDQISSCTGLSPDGRHVVLQGDSLMGVSEADRSAYRAYREQMDRFAAALEPFWLKTMPRIAPGSLGDMKTFAHMGLNLRRMGKDRMREFLRVFSLPMRDLMDENFESDRLKAMLSWDGLVGSRMAPRSPNNAVLTLLYRMAGDSVGCSAAALVTALNAAATAAGAKIRTGVRVESIETAEDASGLRVTGVRDARGEIVTADCVISSADPKATFLSLLGAPQLEIGFTNRIDRLRCRSYVAKLHLALGELPIPDGAGPPTGRFFTAPDLDAIEFAFDDAKYGRLSEFPVLEFIIPSAIDASLAPGEAHVLSANVMYAPYDLKGGWNNSARELLRARCLEVLESCLPGIRDNVVASELLSPADIEREYGVTGGHWHHVEMALDQMLMMRPTYEAAQYATPIPGLYLCGAGSHPGGDLTGAPGFNAAREILK